MRPKLLTFAISFCFAFTSFAQITPLKIEKSQKSKRTIIQYDSLENITRYNLPSLAGQQVQILPRIPIGGTDLATGPTLYSSKPGWLNNNNKVVNPDTRFTIYNSRFGSFTNEVFSIIGADSVFSDTYGKYRSVYFYLIVKNNKYPSPHYLGVGLTNDEYDYNNNLIRRGDFSAGGEFVILGYFDKLRHNSLGKKYVLRRPHNEYIGGEKILYNLSDGEPLKAIPENLTLTIKDLTLIDSQYFKGLAYIYSSDSIPDTFSRPYLGYFEDFDTFYLSQQKKKIWEKEMIRKYGKTNGQLIIAGKVRLGFSKKMCEEAWGTPNDINKSTGSWGTHEQWVYGTGNYLYFENGKLTSIDN